MTNQATTVTKAVTTTNDATDWVLMEKGDQARISIPSGITGTVNVESSFDGSTAEGVMVADDGSSNFSAGAQMHYVSEVREFIRIKAPTVSAGSATVKIRRN